MNLLAIALGGAIGSVARYLLSALVLRVSGPSFPLGTFVVNMIGCVAFGALAGAATGKLSLTPEQRLFLFAGVLGGFTTFSSYVFESFVLIREGHVLAASINIVGQVVIGLVTLAAGYFVAST